MKLCFDSIEEVRDFVGSLKGKRGTLSKADDDGQPVAAGAAPPPLQPPQGGATFAPAAFTPPQGSFPGAPVGGVQADPAVQALVGRIVTRIDGAINGGQPADAVLTWFRSQCGPEATNATMDQIKTVFLPKLSVPALENIAKLMNA